MEKVGVFIPCYNVARSIEAVLVSFPADVLQRIDAIIVVDNHSKDETLEILKRVQAAPGLLGEKVIIIANQENYGLGGSQKIAYQYFLDQGYTRFFVVHGDGQGDGAEIAKNFFDVFDEDPDIDLIMTSRFLKQSVTAGYSQLRIWGNYVFNFLTWFFAGRWMSDSGAAIIFMKCSLLRQVPFAELTNSFQFNPELNILLMNLPGLRMKEIPLKWKDSTDRSNIAPTRYCWELLGILFRFFIKARLFRQSPSRAFHDSPQGIKPMYRVLR
ncbi:MAG: glycosyltransferase family 2 protein [Candidatus Omnitrophica bacterium]|nr:glycosyltransferase family 2 protein [Candidatus Omnitrophota bacterium]